MVLETALETDSGIALETSPTMPLASVASAGPASASRMHVARKARLVCMPSYLWDSLQILSSWKSITIDEKNTPTVLSRRASPQLNILGRCNFQLFYCVAHYKRMLTTLLLQATSLLSSNSSACLARPLTGHDKAEIGVKTDCTWHFSKVFRQSCPAMLCFPICNRHDAVGTNQSRPCLDLELTKGLKRLKESRCGPACLARTACLDWAPVMPRYACLVKNEMVVLILKHTCLNQAILLAFDSVLSG